MNKKVIKANKIHDICIIGLSAAFIAVCSWIAVPFPIALTLQIFAICAVSGILGAKKGILSTLVYIFLGLIGLPVFSGFRGGIGAFADLSSGYIFGFVLISVIVGVIADLKNRKFLTMLVAMSLGMLSCYACGSIWYYFIGAENASFGAILTVCVLPFIIPDAIKIILAATVVSYIDRRVKLN